MKKPVILAVVAVVVLGVGVGGWFAREAWQDRKRCERFAELAAKFGTDPFGSGPNAVRVIGDSYTEGMGLDVPRESWVSAFAVAADATVTADGASSTGFTNPGSCGRGSFVDRAAGAGEFLIVQGGLNDVHATEDELRGAVCAIVSGAGSDVVIVGPPPAPVRDAADLQRVDRGLSAGAEECGARYVSTLNWDDLEYVDGLHPTRESHALFGTRVAEQLGQPGR